MSNLIGSLIQYSLIYCFIVGLILVLRGPTYRIAGARWAYALWFTLFVPLLIPLAPWLLPTVFFSSSIEPYALLERVKFVASTESAGIFTLATVSIWLAGMMFTAWRVSHTSLRLKSALNAGSHGLTRSQQREFSKVCSQLRVFPSPRVRVSPDLEGPAICGMINPVVYLPVGFFDRFSASERTLMLYHEICHYLRKDAWWNTLFCVLNCLFWFNPLFRFAERRFRQDQERSCDQFVLWDEPRVQRARYANAMLKIAASPSTYGPIHFQSNAPEIVGRMTMLEQHKKTIPQSLYGFVSMALLVMAILIIAVPVIEANDTISLSSGWCSIYQGLGL